MKSLIPSDKINELLPQKHPFVMIKEMLDYQENEITTRTKIDAENLFIEKGKFNESGLIENFAQSIALHTSYGYFLRNEVAPVGYIGSVSNAIINRLPKVGEVIITKIEIITEFSGITLVQGETRCNGEMILSAKMKTFIAN